MSITRLLGGELEKILNGSKSILLLGPRQTGKSTLINEIISKRKEEIVIFKLQDLETYQEVAINPSVISKVVEEKLKSKSNILLFIDEIQKIPVLLDGCQYLIDEYKQKVKVILTGSSARKLREKGVNLLPGRVIVENLQPLILNEIFNLEEQKIVPINFCCKKKKELNITLEELLIYGSLPEMLTATELRDKILNSYVLTYLQEEIRQEALVRNLGLFSKFLELSANESNKIMNFSNISQDSGIPASTVKNYFQILEDTLVTYLIPPFIRKIRKQILSTQKFIYFDLGVRNKAAKLTLNKKNLNKEIGGRLFEEFIILELIKRIKYCYPDWKYFFWRTNHGLEVDLIIQKEDEIIPIEIKYTNNPQKKHIKHLEIFMEEYKCKKGYLVGTFTRAMKLTDKITAIPWKEI